MVFMDQGVFRRVLHHKVRNIGWVDGLIPVGLPTLTWIEMYQKLFFNNYLDLSKLNFFA